jgi:hypothetical protein
MSTVNKDFKVKNGLSVGGNIDLSGTVDGRDLAVDGTKLDGVTTGATPDQTKADIEGLGIAASSLTGALPAIDGSLLTNLPSGGGGGGDLVKIATQSFDGSLTSLTFTDCFSDTYDYYQVVLSQLENDSGGWAEFYGLLSSDSGSTWHSDYGYIDTSQTKLRYGGVDFGSNPLYQIHGNFMITGARDTDAFTTNIGQIMRMTNTGVSSYPIDIRNTLKSKAAVDTIKFYPSSGTMDRGTITIYGLKG